MTLITAVIAVYLVIGSLTLRFAPTRSGNEAAPY